MKEREQRRGQRKDQCQNCLFSSDIRYTSFGRFIECTCEKNGRYFGKMLPITKPTCDHVAWKSVLKSVMLKDNDLYLNDRGMYGKDK